MSSYCKVCINGQEVEADEERKLMYVLRNDLLLLQPEPPMPSRSLR